MYVPKMPKGRDRSPRTPETPDEKAPAILDAVETIEANFLILDAFFLMESKAADLPARRC
jgi:hypothetical protein